MKRTVTAAILSMAALAAAAQAAEPTISAALEPDSVAIGDHFTLSVDVERDMMQVVAMPEFAEGKLTEHIEILDIPAPDTLSRDGRRLKLRYRYKLTSFEQGAHNIGRFPALYLDKNITDTLHTRDSLILRVGSFEIDTLTQTIYDVKAPAGMPVRFGEFSGYMLMTLAGLCLTALLTWLYIRYRKDGGLPPGAKPRELVPPHIRAIEALEALHNRKLWQNGKHKQYYTGLTDIIREYMEGRWGMAAMEMTSEEIIAALRPLGIHAGISSRLEDLLRTADLVKFAKYTPAAEENGDSYDAAYYFVEETKQILTQQEEAQ